MTSVTESEWEIHQCVINRLESAENIRPGLTFWHTPNGAYYGGGWGQARKMQRAGVRAGIPDIFIILDGVWHCLELKSEKGKLATAQKRWLEFFASIGCKTAVTYGMRAALKQLEAWGIP